MSKLRMYSVRDGGVGAFMRPWCARSDGEAIRIFTDEVNRGDSAIAQHPEDYALMYIGEFDDDAGVISVPLVPHGMGLGAQYVKPSFGDTLVQIHKEA